MSVELVNPDIDRVDAVNGPATGIPFLMFKSANTPKEAAVADTDTPVAPEETKPVAKAEEPAAAPAEAEPAVDPVEKAEAPAAPAEPAAEPVEESPVVKAEEPPAAEASVVKAGTVALPSGLLELLGEVVAAYQQLVETDQTAPESPADAEAPAAAAADVPAPVADALAEESAPVEDALEPEAPAPVPAEAPALPPEPAPGKAPVEAPAPAAESTAPAEEDKDTKRFAKSLDDAVLAAVAKATAPLLEANAELLKRLEIVEATPVDSGPFLAGQTPGNAGQPSLRGQDVGGAAVGLMKSAAPQPPSGMDALAAGLKSAWAAQ